MKASRLCSSAAILAIAIVAILFAAPKPALADTYQIFNLISDQGYFFYGMDDLGTVVIDRPVCDGSSCYFTFVDGISTGYSSTAPTLVADNGTPCSPSVPSGGEVLHGVCNNGREAFTGFLTSGQVIPAVYTGPDPVTDFLAQGGEGSIFMNSLGDIVWDDHFTEDWYEAIDTTVPEPSSLFLLGTGLLAGIGAMRRRLL